MSSPNNKICFVTAFFDLNRDSWPLFKRTFNEYLSSFGNFVNLFDDKNTQAELIAYIDDRHLDQVYELTKSHKQITIIPMNQDFMHTNLPMWKTLEREREIMNSEKFRNMIPHRLIYPEHTIPEYTLINHCKIDFVSCVINSNITDAYYFSWVDFGYCSTKESIPDKLLDISKLNLEKVNYTLVNALTEYDKDIIYTLKYAPERIGGFFFFGNRNVLKEYQSLYHKILELYQGNNIADDDQALALACYWTKPDLFHLHGPFGWHKALVKFQL